MKPGAIGLMTASNLLGDRPFLRSVNLGIPHSYGELFGPGSGAHGGSDVLVVWSDDLNTPAEIDTTSSSSISVSTTEALGAPGSLSLSSSSPSPFTLSGAPLYLTFPAGDSVSVEPAESFGTNRLLRQPRPRERRGDARRQAPR